MRVEATLAGAFGSLERHGYDLFDHLHQFADLGRLIVRVVAAPPPGDVMALVQKPLDPELVFPEVESASHLEPAPIPMPERRCATPKI